MDRDGIVGPSAGDDDVVLVGSFVPSTGQGESPGGSASVPGQHGASNAAQKMRRKRKLEEREQEDREDPDGAAVRALARTEAGAENLMRHQNRMSWLGNLISDDAESQKAKKADLEKAQQDLLLDLETEEEAKMEAQKIVKIIAAFRKETSDACGLRAAECNARLHSGELGGPGGVSWIQVHAEMVMANMKAWDKCSARITHATAGAVTQGESLGKPQANTDEDTQAYDDADTQPGRVDINAAAVIVQAVAAVAGRAAPTSQPCQRESSPDPSVQCSRAAIAAAESPRTREAAAAVCQPAATEGQPYLERFLSQPQQMYAKDAEASSFDDERLRCFRQQQGEQSKRSKAVTSTADAEPGDGMAESFGRDE